MAKYNLLDYLSFHPIDILKSLSLIFITLYIVLVLFISNYFPNMYTQMIVYPSLGLAFALIIINGIKTWPSIFIATFISFILLEYSFLFSFFIALFTTIEVIIGLELLSKEKNFDYNLKTSKDYFKLLIYMGIIATFIGALFYTFSFYLFNYITTSNILNAFKNIWMGIL